MWYSRFIHAAYKGINTAKVPEKSPSILVNGCNTDQISVLDRGFQYGDGLFETIYCSDGNLQYWNEHMERLVEGCRRLKIPLSDLDSIELEARKLCQDTARGVLKISITRGLGRRGYATESSANPTRVLALYSPPNYPKTHWTDGVTVTVCSTRLTHNAALAGIKHMNRLEQILARTEWDSVEIQEGLMLDINNNIIEGTMSNVFCVRNGELSTPNLSLCGIKGIMREQVIKNARKQGYIVNETNLSLEMLHSSDEIFLCNSLIGIWPVRKLENKVFQPGTITHELARTLQCMQPGVENVA